MYLFSVCSEIPTEIHFDKISSAKNAIRNQLALCLRPPMNFDNSLAALKSHQDK